MVLQAEKLPITLQWCVPELPIHLGIDKNLFGIRADILCQKYVKPRSGTFVVVEESLI
jgi:hypothetical protein